jgi:hypothetical protein
MRNLDGRVARLEKHHPPSWGHRDEQGRRLVRIDLMIPDGDGNRPDDIAPMTEEYARAHGLLWIPERDDRYTEDPGDGFA